MTLWRFRLRSTTNERVLHLLPPSVVSGRAADVIYTHHRLTGIPLRLFIGYSFPVVIYLIRTTKYGGMWGRVPEMGGWGCSRGPSGF